jgi:hypothetical protein
MSIFELRAANKYGKDEIIKGDNYEAELKYSVFNCRIVVKSYRSSNSFALANRLKTEAKKKEYGKVWIKVRESSQKGFVDAGFIPEARINDFYLDEDAVIMAFYSNEERAEEFNKEKKDQIIAELKDVKMNDSLTKLEERYSFKFADQSDAAALSKLFNNVVDAYPVPIF